MTLICINCKHPLKTLGLSELSYFQCDKCGIVIKKNEVNSSIDSKHVKYMKNDRYNEKLAVTIKDLIDNLKYNSEKLDLNLISEFIKTILLSDTIFIGASGQSKLIGSAFCMRLCHLGLKSFIMGEITSPQILPEDCLIIISRFGEKNPELVYAKKAKSQGCKILFITSNPSSKIAELSDITWNVSSLNKDHLETVSDNSIFEITSQFLLDGLITELVVELNLYESSLKNKHFNLEQ
ncbi:MAG: SIS domain-containing protein [Methanobrevibacter sp.]|jgi:6-phospho-3-hexuloisomerase|nr:SIS domain-containing protein [Candidatus Methanovirga aequatorialis]